MAVLDAVMSPEWEYRYFSYDAAWRPGENMASMRNGQGDDWSITFTSAGTYVRAFDHESALSPFAQQPPGLVPGLWEGLPAALREASDEPAFAMDDLPLVTLALWRLPEQGYWSFGDVPEIPGGDDGGTWLFGELDGRADTYRAFAETYYERAVDVGAIGRVFAVQPLTAELVTALNPVVALGDIANEVAEMGYPLG